MTLASCNNSPRSTRSAPHPLSLRKVETPSVFHNEDGKENRTLFDESPYSLKSTSTERFFRTSSMDSHSSVESRSCHRRLET